ncbi:HVA22-like protein k isoform X2 [Euphorbia lathyris]|uniref:HVA22-like protein k isoform X2 n=1 Tax=Euphorbia lathyris TaxID=212925 RepID=UPI003313C480
MAFLGSNITTEVGLRLLLSPLGSNIVVRTACCTVGVVLPVYSTFKAIEGKNQNEQQKWLIYWAAYGSLSLVEVFADKLLSWVPMYYHVKFAFLVWLQLPSAYGAQKIYSNHLRPFFSRHQARVDLLVGFAHGEVIRIVSKHQAEIEFAKSILLKFTGPPNHMRRRESDESGEHLAIENETSISTHRADLRAFEHDASTITDTESDHDA